MEVKRVNKRPHLTQNLSISQLETQVSGVSDPRSMCSSCSCSRGTHGKTVSGPRRGHRGRAGATAEVRRRRGEGDSTVLLVREETHGWLEAMGAPQKSWHLAPGSKFLDEKRACMVQDTGHIWPSSTFAPSGSKAFQPVPNLNKRNPQHSLAQHLLKIPQRAYNGISIKISLSFFFPGNLSVLPAISQPHSHGLRRSGRGPGVLLIF